jgi:transcriptional regulator with XRE-family HTH domain
VVKVETLKQIGTTIKILRKYKNLSQEQLGELANFHYSYIGRIERGQKNLSIKSLEKIASALGLSIYQLFAYADQIEDEEADIIEILSMLKQLKKGDIKKAKVILQEVFFKNYD